MRSGHGICHLTRPTDPPATMNMIVMPASSRMRLIQYSSLPLTAAGRRDVSSRSCEGKVESEQSETPIDRPSAARSAAIF